MHIKMQLKRRITEVSSMNIQTQILIKHLKTEAKNTQRSTTMIKQVCTRDEEIVHYAKINKYNPLIKTNWKKDIIIALHAEKAFDKIQHHFTIIWKESSLELFMNQK